MRRGWRGGRMRDPLRARDVTGKQTGQQVSRVGDSRHVDTNGPAHLAAPPRPNGTIHATTDPRA